MSDTAELQLDRAEFGEQHVTACGGCATPLATEYFEADGVAVCRGCSEGLRAVGTQGSSASRALRAIVAGLGAAVAGSFLYYAILALSGYEFGLIAIVVGMGVGKAVNWGSYGRGGWRYQTIAIALTYVSIVGSYVPLIFEEVGKQPVTAEASADGTEASAGAPAAPEAVDTPPTLAGALAAIVVFAGLVLAIPFLAGAENIIGIIIIGIGLYEAWKFNRKAQVNITGPHAIAAPQAV